MRSERSVAEKHHNHRIMRVTIGLNILMLWSNGAARRPSTGHRPAGRDAITSRRRRLVEIPFYDIVLTCRFQQLLHVIVCVAKIIAAKSAIPEQLGSGC
jgi:hypothetical protein